MAKKFFRCTVCGDVHWGVNAPEKCPTCMQLNKYVEVDADEAKKLLFENASADPMPKQEFRAAIEKYCDNNAFALNPEKVHVDRVIDGVYSNLEKKGLKYCPCRISASAAKLDSTLLCPCNFEAQGIWRTEGRCWCGLFIKRS